MVELTTVAEVIGKFADAIVGKIKRDGKSLL